MRHPLRAPGLVLPLLLAVGCASNPPKGQAPVDLTEARNAVERARAAGAEQKAPETFSKAADHLRDAEAEAARGDKDSAARAALLGSLATEGAQCALDLSRAGGTARPNSSQAGSRDPSDLERRLEASQADRKHLEEQVSELERERTVLHREILRTKARLEGSATMEEASSAIAEARILRSRIPQDKASAARLARCTELIAQASAELRHQNYGPALFFALDAQEQASGPDVPGAAAEATPPKQTYTVKSAAKLRKGPGLDEPALGSLGAGTTVEALLVQGEWLKVRAGRDEGWIHRSLVE
jgi:hypothetical protein